jgi:hypothetical protein
MKHWCLSCCHAVVFQQTNKILHSTIPWSICSGHACLLLYAFFILPYLTCQSNHLLIFFGICCNAPRWYSSALLLDLSTSWSLSCRSYLQMVSCNAWPTAHLPCFSALYDYPVFLRNQDKCNMQMSMFLRPLGPFLNLLCIRSENLIHVHMSKRRQSCSMIMT